MSEEMAAAMQGTSSDAFASRYASAQMRPYSTYSKNLGKMATNVARVRGAPPGYYEHPPYDGISVYMAMSRNVGRIDVGDGVFDMSAQARDFVVGVPGSGGKMDSFRGGHGMQVILSPRVLDACSEDAGALAVNFQKLHRSFHSHRKVSDLMVRLAGAGLAAHDPDPLLVDSLVLSLVDALMDFSASHERRTREVTPLDSRTLAVIVDYMDARFGEQITVDQLAHLAGLPLTRFLKAFRNAVGETPYQHLMRRRLEAARLMLMTDAPTIVEIAFDCGFSSQHHLTGLFSERFGISPAAFRKQCLSGDIVERPGAEMA